MSAETIPSDVPDDVWAIADAETRRGIWLPRGEVAQAIVRAILTDRATRPAEPAAPVAEVVGYMRQKDADAGWFWVTRRGNGYYTEPLVRLSTLEAERARADAAEQRAADALAREEKAERERDAYHDALTPGGDTKALMIGEFFEEIEVRNPDYDDESQDEDEDDEPEFITHRVPVSWTTTKAMMERLRSYAHWLAASREAQPATDGGDNG